MKKTLIWLMGAISSRQLFVQRHRRSMFSLRAFSVAGPAACNSLPDYLRHPTRSFDSFRSDLKTFRFSLYQRTQRIRGFAIMRYINLLLTLTLTRGRQTSVVGVSVEMMMVMVTCIYRVNADDHSRVKLERAGVDYINASLVLAAEADRSYILTQVRQFSAAGIVTGTFPVYTAVMFRELRGFVYVVRSAGVLSAVVHSWSGYPLKCLVWSGKFYCIIGRLTGDRYCEFL